MSLKAAPFAAKYPSSTSRPSGYFRWPGVTWESTRAVREVLEENDRGYDIYESRRFAHNHFPHSVLTRYSLGATPKLIRETWEHDRSQLVSLDPRSEDRQDVNAEKVPDEIDRNNWKSYLGDKGCYAPYLSFFHSEITRLGNIGALKEYIFSPQANWEPSGLSEKDMRSPNMLNRLAAGVLHPFIHVGFGLEFGDRVILAEGLAEIAVHPDIYVSRLIPSTVTKDFFTLPPSSSISPSVISLYTDFLSSPILVPPTYDPDCSINDALKATSSNHRAEELRDIVGKWALSDEELSDGEGGWEKKMKEIAVFVTLLACGTGREGYEPRVDFFLMHSLTSSLFLPAYLPVVPIPARRALLKTYMLELLHTAAARGRPELNPGLLMSYDPYAVIAGSEKPLKVVDMLGSGEADEQNAWMKVVEMSLVYPDSHIIKSIRALIHYSTLYGDAEPGFLVRTHRDGDRGLEAVKGLDKMDGSVFLRAAGMIMSTMAKGGEARWDRSQLGYDDAWE